MFSIPTNTTFRRLALWQPHSLWCVTPARVHALRWELTALAGLVTLAAVLRFWGVDGWGLEYDEETMAMSAAHIVEHGYPALPSGMTYVRGFVQLYAMAGSTILFGETEWALRLPSVLCGLLLIVLAYYQGRRFLRPLWNIAFAATVALLPALILDSQEARMYVFMMTSIVAFTLLVFRWERTGRVRDLVAAVAIMALAVQFQALAIFSSFVLFFPGLVHGDWKKLLQGAGAFFVAGTMLLGITEWTNSFYPPSPDDTSAAAAMSQQSHPALLLVAHPVLIVLGVALAGVLANFIKRSIAERAASWAAAALIFAGFVAQLALFYHLGILLLIAGAVVAHRHLCSRKVLIGVAVASLGLAVVHMGLLHASGLDWPRKLIGAMVGQPSVWPYLRFATYAPFAAVLFAAGIGLAVWRIASRQRVPDVWLYGVLAVLLPLFLVGFFTWYLPVRYTQFALVPFLMCAFAVLPGALNSSSGQQATETPKRKWQIAAAFASIVAIVNPAAVAQVVNAGYSIHPDHKGAAQYILSQQLRPNDILIAEDVLQQTYYLGRVHYWLVGKDTASKFTRDFRGRILDIYTHTPVLDTGEALRAVLEKPDRGAVYIIGSGEQQEDNRAHVRSHGIQEVMHSASVGDVVYFGRDGLTKVWKSPPRVTSEAQSSYKRPGSHDDKRAERDLPCENALNVASLRTAESSQATDVRLKKPTPSRKRTAAGAASPRGTGLIPASSTYFSDGPHAARPS